MKTTATHTPGPWRTGDLAVTIFGPKSDHPAPVTIAHLATPGPRLSVSEQKANARLIAAAPEMLAALESIIDSAHDNTSELFGLHMRERGTTTPKNRAIASGLTEDLKRVQRARAIIAKARGDA